MAQPHACWKKSHLEGSGSESWGLGRAPTRGLERRPRSSDLTPSAMGFQRSPWGSRSMTRSGLFLEGHPVGRQGEWMGVLELC